MSKPSRRKVEVQVEYIGFEIEDKFVVGYGLDNAGQFRHLPFIGVQDKWQGCTLRYFPTAARTDAANLRASASTAGSSSVSILRSRIRTRPFTITVRTSSPRAA